MRRPRTGSSAMERRRLRCCGAGSCLQAALVSIQLECCQLVAGACRCAASMRALAVSGGLANCADPASGRSPLHAAALNGAGRAAETLLEAGALVHVRDALGHTPLYYAARQGSEEVVELLVRAGANLGGADVEGGFVRLAVDKAVRARDEAALRVWKKAGASIDGAL